MYNSYQEKEPVVFEQKKPRKVKLKSTVAGILAVMVLGGACGYAGAHMSNYNDTLERGNTDVVQIPLDDDTAEESVALSTDTLAKTPSGTPYTTEQLYEEVKDTVVAIKLYQLNPFTRQESGDVAGSGVIFTTDGYLLTNYHVVTDNNKISVLVNDYKDDQEIHEYPATIVGLDEPTDLAILKIERDEPFKAASLGNSDKLKIGQTVCPIGNPLGLSKSMTMGIVSGLNREGTGGYELNSIQIDAAVNMGNSGGPLFDMSGKVVGIVNKKLVYDNLVENIGFAITINEAKPIINDLMANGEVTSRPILGITTMPFDQYMASYYGITGVSGGLLITSVQENSPAYQSGITRGDILIKVNGKDVAGVEDVQAELKSRKVGDTVSVTVMRFDSNGRAKTYDIDVELISSAG